MFAFTLHLAAMPMPIGSSRPASTLVEISRLVRDDLLIEIEAVAVLPER